MTDNSSLDGETREFHASDAHKGWRLDHFLAVSLQGLSRSRLQALIAQGHVTLAGETIGDPNKRVKPGDNITISIPPPASPEPQPQHIPLTIVHEDSDLIVIDKPAGLVVHPAAGNRDGTLVNALLAHCGISLSGIGGVARPGIVHRLDKDTSRVMVVAKTDPPHHGLSRLFADHDIERVYIALTRGALRPARATIETRLARSPYDRKKIA